MAGLSNDLKITMLDKFYLGGPLSVRGFQMRGIGKHAELNALGAHVSEKYFFRNFSSVIDVFF